MERGSGLRAAVAATALLLSTLGMTSWASAQGTVTLRFASAFSPLSTNNAKTVPAWIKAVEAASEGTLKIEHYTGGALGRNPFNQLELVETGVVDIAEVAASFTPGRFKNVAVFEVPLLADTNTDAGLATNILYEKGLLDGFADLKVVGFILSGPNGLVATKPIADFASLKGRNIRTNGPVQIRTAEAAGGVPVGNLAITELAEGLSRGILDVVPIGISNFYTFKLADVAEHFVVNTSFGHNIVMFPMRKDTYEKLPPKAKAAIDKYSGRWFSALIGCNHDIVANEVIAKLRAEKKVYDWTDADKAQLQKAIAPIVADWDKPNAQGVNLWKETQAAVAAARKEIDGGICKEVGSR